MPDESFVHARRSGVFAGVPRLPTPPKGPRKLKIALVGAGAVGASTALWLARAGHHVTLIDRLGPGEGASYGNAGAIATYALHPVARPDTLRKLPRMLVDPESPLSIRFRHLPRLAGWLARFLWASRTARVAEIEHLLAALMSLAEPAWAELAEEADATHLVARRGVLYVHGSDAAHRADAATVAAAQAAGVPAELIPPEEVRQLEPNLAAGRHGAMLYPEAAHLLDPREAVRAIADAALARGTHLVTAEITALESEADGRVRVVHGAGAESFDKVVVAAGAWSRRLLGASMPPLDAERGYHLMFEGAEDLVRRPICWDPVGFYMTPMRAGLRVGGTVELASLDAPPTQRRLDMLERHARRLLPRLGPVGSTWLGFRPSMPDSLPVVGEQRARPNVVHAYGHGHVGLTLGPVTGYLVACLIAGAGAPLDAEPLSPDRF
jgi:D-amino-acid dehydrogenase